MQERFNIQNQYQQLQEKTNNKRDIGLTRWEWATEMNRDTLNSNIQSPSRLNYFSICENVPQKVIQRRMYHQMILPVGKRPSNNQIINNIMLSKNYVFFYEKIQQEKNLFQLWQIYNQLLRGQKETAFERIQNYGEPQEDMVCALLQLFLRSRNIQKRYWINDLWALAEEFDDLNSQQEQEDNQDIVNASELTDNSDRQISIDDNSFISTTKKDESLQQKQSISLSQDDSQDNNQKILLNEILNIVKLIQSNINTDQNNNQIEFLIKNLIDKEGHFKGNKKVKFDALNEQFQVQQVLCFVLLNLFKRKKQKLKKFVINKLKFMCRFDQNSTEKNFEQDKLENLNLILKQKIYQHRLNFFLELKNIQNFAEKLYSRYLDQQQNDLFFINLEEDYLKKVDKKSFLKQLNKIIQ